MGRLISVNVGLPGDIAWRGETVSTGIWKQAVQGRRVVRRTISARFSPPCPASFAFGQFGENFTVDGLSDDEVCIGDHQDHCFSPESGLES